jgi:hypothetical protein
MSAKGGKHGFETLAVMLPSVPGQIARSRVFAALIRRNGEDAVAWPQLGKHIVQQRLQLLRG